MIIPNFSPLLYPMATTSSSSGNILEDLLDDDFEDLFDDLSIHKAFGLEIYEYPFTVKDYPFTVEGVNGFLIDNSFNAADQSDIMFGVIVVKLVDLELIIPNNKSAFDLSDTNAQQNIPEVLDEAKLEMFSSFAKTMIFVALHVKCKGKFDAESDAFYKSFCSAKGPLLTQSKFNTILKMLISSGRFTKITKIITVGDIKSDTDVFKHKLTFPTPGLVQAALKRFPIKKIHSMFDPVAVRDYINFDKAGILAYVASGPLAGYCNGKVDVMEVGVENIPEDLPLRALQAIERPYDKATIKMAYIILTETRYKFGKWYQGEKAIRPVCPADLKFRAIVRAVIKALMQKKFATDAKTDQDDSQTSSQEEEESSGAIQKSATNSKTAVDVSESSSQDGGESSVAIQNQKSAINLKRAVDVSETSSQDGVESSGCKI